MGIKGRLQMGPAGIALGSGLIQTQRFVHVHF